MEPVYEVVWPLGRSVTQAFEPGARVTDLRGKTIGQLSLGSFRADDMFPLIRDQLSERFTDIKFVDASVFGRIHGRDEREVIAALPDKLHEYGVDAVISAVGA
jgi:hypothetical protein